MSSLDEANHFVNCIMNRYRNDTIMRADATILLIAIPFISIGFGYAIIAYTQNEVKINDYLYSVAMMMIWFLLLIMMFLTYRRLEDHSNRDTVWRDILVHYAKERGCNTVNLEKLNRRCHKMESTAIIYPASILLAAYFVVFVLAICYPKIVYYQAGIHLNIYALTILGAVFNFLMFILVYTYSMKYPYKHESSQIKFMQEFRYIMYGDGLDVPEMLPSVKHSWLIIHIFLFVITGGLYAVYLIFMVYRSTNNHLYNQWSYEIKLMNAIVIHEGGKGIVAAKDKKQLKKEAKKNGKK